MAKVLKTLMQRWYPQSGLRTVCQERYNRIKYVVAVLGCRPETTICN